MNNLREAFFILHHPVTSAKAVLIQWEVGADHRMPPPGSTIEEFPVLPISKAASLIMQAEQQARQLEKPVPDGVIWSARDQELLSEGKRPIGRPLHPNI